MLQSEAVGELGLAAFERLSRVADRERERNMSVTWECSDTVFVFFSCTNADKYILVNANDC